MDPARAGGHSVPEFLIFDAADEGRASALGTRWHALSDRVMGGVSNAVLESAHRAGRQALCLHGEVRLENNGGFVQMGLDLAPSGAAIDASGYLGVRMRVLGNGEGIEILD